MASRVRCGRPNCANLAVVTLEVLEASDRPCGLKVLSSTPVCAEHMDQSGRQSLPAHRIIRFEPIQPSS